MRGMIAAVWPEKETSLLLESVTEHNLDGHGS